MLGLPEVETTSTKTKDGGELGTPSGVFGVIPRVSRCKPSG